MHTSCGGGSKSAVGQAEEILLRRIIPQVEDPAPQLKKLRDRHDLRRLAALPWLTAHAERVRQAEMVALVMQSDAADVLLLRSQRTWVVVPRC